MTTTEYPQYRKYKNNKSFFKIISAEKFIEIQWIGKEKLQFEKVAKILPDRNFIADMTFDYEESWDKITEEEFERLTT